MPYTLSSQQGYVRLDWSGIITTNDLRSIGKDLTKVMNDAGRAPQVLHVFKRVQGMNFGPWAMFVHALRREDTKLINRCKSAQVATDDKARSVCKMFLELNRNPNIEMQLFDTETAAIAWLRA